MPGLLKLSVFISSPGDVGQERVLATHVLERLQGEFSGQVELQPIIWEHEPLRATATFQEQIPPPSGTDIVVCILWSRLGTRLPENFRPAPGMPPPTGTEWELEDAARSYRAKGTPDLLVYRKTSDPLVPLTDEEVVVDRLRQKKALDAFIDRWFGNAQDSFKAAFHSFASPDEFEGLLETHLQKLIRERLPKAGAAAGRPAATVWPEGKGSPYRGLEVFGMEHAPVFCGRTRAIGAVKDALARQAARGCAFVLVLGMSGCGKSSLVRAGLLPTLIQPGVIEGVGLVRWCIFRPSDAGGDLAGGLAQALVSASAVPELVPEGYDARELGALLREAPQLAVTPIRMGLKHAAAAVAAREKLVRPPEPRLAVVIDQMEELFTLERVQPAERTGFVAALSALARSGQVWVLATLRSDFYARCVEILELVALKEGAGQYDLLPPALAEIGQMIRYPAQAAGLHFGVKPESQERLDDVLHEAAARDPEALPLLEFTLDELYKRRTADGELTFAAYRGLGEMKGALAQRAEEVYGRLRPPVQALVPALFRALATVRHGDEDVVVARRVPRERLENSAEARELLEAFIGARLLVSDRERADDGKAVVGVAHEALLQHWPRLKQWLAEDRDFLRTRARVAEAAERWRQEGQRPDLLLPEGKPLAEAVDLLARRRGELDPALVGYTETSARYAASRRRRKVLTGAAVAIAFCVMASVAALVSYGQWQNAVVQKQAALEQKGKADEARDVAQKQELAARRNAYVANISRAYQLWEGGQIEQLRPLLEQQRPNPGEQDLRGFEWYYLWRLAHRAGLHTLRGHDGPVNAVAYAPDGKTLASAGKEGVIKFWSTAGGQEVRALRVKRNGLGIVLNHQSGKFYITGVTPGGPAAQDKRLQVKDELVGVSGPDGGIVKTAGKGFADVLKLLAGRPGTPVQLEVLPAGAATTRVYQLARGEFEAEDAAILHLAFSPDGRWLASATATGVVRLRDVNSGQEMATINAHKGEVTALAFSPDGKVLATGGVDQAVGIWNVPDGKSVRHIPNVSPLPSTRQGLGLAFTPDGKALAITDSALLSLWDVDKGKAVLTEYIPYVLQAAFSPDGKTLALGEGSGSGVIRLWDTATQTTRLYLRGHSNSVTALAFTPDSKTLVSASADHTARVWDVGTGAQVNNLRGHANSVHGLALSPDGQRLATAGFDEVVIVWDPFQDQSSLRLPAGDVYALAFTPDGRSLLTGGGVEGAAFESGPVLQEWDPHTGKLRATLQDSLPSISTVAFSPDGKTLAAGSGKARRSTSEATLWDLESGKAQAILANVTGGFTAVAWSPEGRFLAVGTGDARRRGPGEIYLCDIKATKTRRIEHGHTGPVTWLAFAPDGQTFASGSMDETVKLWDTASGQERTTLKGHASAVSALAFSPDGCTLAVGCTDPNFVGLFPKPGDLKLWDITKPEKPTTLKGNLGGVLCLAFSPDGKVLATGGMDRTVKLWDVAAGKEQDVLSGFKTWVTSVAFTPDSKTLAASSGDPLHDTGEIRLWDVASRKERPGLAGFKGAVMTISISPDGKTLAGGSLQGQLKLWSLDDGTETVVLQGQDPEKETGHKGYITCTATSPDGKTLATGSVDKTVKLWDLATGKVRATLPEQRSAVMCLAFSPDGNTLATGSGGTWDSPQPGELKVWSAATGELRVALGQPSLPITAVAFSRDGKILAAAGGNQPKRQGEVQLWEMPSGIVLTRLNMQVAVSGVAFAPDGNTLAIADGLMVKFWDLRAGQGGSTIRAHRGQISSMSFSPDGRTLATAGYDKTVKLWQVATGAGLLTLNAHNRPDVLWVPAVAFSPDGAALATGSSGVSDPGEVRLWQAATVEEASAPGEK